MTVTTNDVCYRRGVALRSIDDLVRRHENVDATPEVAIRLQRLLIWILKSNLEPGDIRDEDTP